MKRKIISLIASLLIISLIGCGNSSNEAASVNSTSENTTNDISVSSDAGESESDDKQEALADLPYFEANNFELTDNTTFQIPFKPYITDSDFSSVVTVNGISTSEAPIGTYTIESISVNNAETEGFKDTTITFKVNLPFEIFFDGASYKGDDWAYGIKYADFELFDYETGAYIPNKTLFNNEAYSNTANIDFNNKQISISVNKLQNISQESVSFNSVPNEEELFSLSANVTGLVTYVITAPSDYDGLILALYKNGVTDISSLDFNIENSDKTHETILDLYDGSTGSDYYVIKISDLK